MKKEEELLLKLGVEICDTVGTWTPKMRKAWEQLYRLIRKKK